MSAPTPLPKGLVPPDFRTSRLLGIFNTLFAAEILLCGLCMCGYTATIPFTSKVMTSMGAQIDQQNAKLRANQLSAIEQMEKDAKTEQQKIDAAAKRLEFEKRPKTSFGSIMDFNKVTMGDSKLMIWSWAELFTGIVLNLAMMISGIGLMHWKPWSRSVAVWTALAKIVRLVLLYGFFILMIVPALSQRIGQMVADMMEQQGTPMPAGGVNPGEFMGKLYTITYSGFGLGFMLCGLVYPVLLLWWLTRPGVKSACSGRFRLPKEPNQPC